MGVDLFVEALGDLIPLLNQIAAAKAAQSDWQGWLAEAQVLNQVAAAKAAQSDWQGWLTEAQGGAA